MNQPRKNRNHRLVTNKNEFGMYIHKKLDFNKIILSKSVKMGQKVEV